MIESQDFLIGLAIGKQQGGGGGDITLETITVTDNGTYTATTGHAYSQVTVNVPSASGVNF